MQFIQMFQLWQYPAAIIFIGAFLGELLYRKTPFPRGVAERLYNVMRAGVASRVARDAGVASMEALATLVGAHEASQIYRALQRQRRRHLLVGMLISGIFTSLAFLYLPVLLLPDWLFGILGLIGVYRVWKSW